MPADPTQPEGALPEPKSIAAECGLPEPDGKLTIRLIGYEVEIDAYRASTMVRFAEQRAADLMTERDAAREELASVLADWNALVKAIGSPTNGGAFWHAAALRQELEELRAEREPLTSKIEAAGRRAMAERNARHDAALAEDTLQELADLSQEMGLYDEPKDERAEFAKWVMTRGFSQAEVDRFHPGIELAWQAWNAARAQQGGQG